MQVCTYNGNAHIVYLGMQQDEELNMFILHVMLIESHMEDNYLELILEC